VAKYKNYDYSQGRFIPVYFDKQILPGTFEHTLHYLIDEEIDLSLFDGRYRNDETGAPAYDPAILLKIILYAYSRGITSSRKIAECCRDNIIFMALSAESAPHFRTIADFISSVDEKMKTSHGVIQGYNGVAVVDDKHQVIVHAEAFGAAQEHELFGPMIEGARKNLEGVDGQQVHRYGPGFARGTGEVEFKGQLQWNQ
jgi:transposase